MTVASSTRSAGPFDGNDVTTEFPFTFKVFSSDDVAVYFTDTDGVQTLLADGYTVALNEDQDSDPGGTVTYPASGAPLASGESLAIIGDLSYEQQTDLTNSGRFLPQVVEAALDYITILCQQLLERMDRKLSLPVGDAGETDLPTATERAGNFLAFDADGNPIAAAGTTEVPVSAFMETVLDDATAADARSTLGLAAVAASGSAADLTTGDLAAARILSALNATGSAPIYAARAWVNFNGTGTVAIRASGNVTSITDNGTGDYTINFTTAMPDANYAASVTGYSGGEEAFIRSATAPAAGALRVGIQGSGGASADVAHVHVVIHR